MHRYPQHESHDGVGLNDLVVVVEDHRHLRNVLGYWFEQEGIRCVVAEDGMSGMTAIRHHRPKVLVTDVYMPHVSGFEIVTKIRDDPKLDGMFIIAITGMAGDEEELRAMKGRADIIMPKPIDERLLLELVHAALADAENTAGLKPPSPQL